MPDTPRVPARSKALLEQWVAEFFAPTNAPAPHVKVAIQDGSEGDDTGLVILRLSHAPADIFMEPRAFDEPRWAATITAREHDLTLSPHDMIGLAAEVALAGSLCTFLQFESLEWDRMSGMR